jgi:hypothetical protein
VKRKSTPVWDGSDSLRTYANGELINGEVVAVVQTEVLMGRIHLSYDSIESAKDAYVRGDITLEDFETQAASLIAMEAA